MIPNKLGYLQFTLFTVCVHMYEITKSANPLFYHNHVNTCLQYALYPDSTPRSELIQRSWRNEGVTATRYYLPIPSTHSFNQWLWLWKYVNQTSIN